jgi:tetratricopeptide (TPR) repeat protein
LNVFLKSNDILLVVSYIKLGRLDEAKNLVSRLDDNNDNYHNLYLRTILSIAKGESDIALSTIELMVNKDVNTPNYALIGRSYLALGELEKAAYWLEKAFKNRDWGLISFSNPGGITVPENLPDNPALQAALDKPELNALFEIRRKNLGLTNKKP